MAVALNGDGFLPARAETAEGLFVHFATADIYQSVYLKSFSLLGLAQCDAYGALEETAEVVEVVLYREVYRALDIVPVVVFGVDYQRRVVFPLVGVADFYGEGVEFLVSLGLCGVRHPCQVVDMLAEGFLEVRHQLLHLCLGCGREILCYVELAQCLAEDAIGDGQGTLPAGTLLLDAGDGLVEGEGGIVEVVEVRALQSKNAQRK